MNEEDFDRKYHYSTRIKSECFAGEGRFETFGKDIKTVLKYANHKTNYSRVWTVVDAEDFDGLLICAGYHLCNRVYYIITNEHWKDENECYEVRFDDYR